MNIHFICRGNVLRSLIAEAYLKSLDIEGLNIISSGTNVDWVNPQEREYFANTKALLSRHQLDLFMKTSAEQLTQDRIDNYHDNIIFMNKRALGEANQIVNLPKNIYVWDIVDIGEGSRVDIKKREIYEEQIYQEIKHKVDLMLPMFRKPLH